MSHRSSVRQRPYKPEEKLPVEIADVYGVHVNDMDIFEAC